MRHRRPNLDENFDEQEGSNKIASRYSSSNEKSRKFPIKRRTILTRKLMLHYSKNALQAQHHYHITIVTKSAGKWTIEGVNFT